MNSRVFLTKRATSWVSLRRIGIPKWWYTFNSNFFYILQMILQNTSILHIRIIGKNENIFLLTGEEATSTIFLSFFFFWLLRILRFLRSDKCQFFVFFKKLGFLALSLMSIICRRHRFWKYEASFDLWKVFASLLRLLDLADIALDFQENFDLY